MAHSESIDHDGSISKTQRKREMHALQALGEALVALSREQLERLDLPDGLRAAIEQAQRIPQRGALRRQLQYVGRLMRQVDADHVKRQLDRIQAGTDADIALLHRAEHWRERLLADADSLSEFIAAFPGTDVQKLRTTLRNAKREQAASRPPRHFRQLLRDIRQTLLNDDQPTHSGA